MLLSVVSLLYEVCFESSCACLDDEVCTGAAVGEAGQLGNCVTVLCLQLVDGAELECAHHAGVNAGGVHALGDGDEVLPVKSSYLVSFVFSYKFI